MAIPRGRALRAVEAAQAAQAAQSAEAAQASSSSSADRRGELQFTATFEGGNLGSVTKVSELEYELSLRPDSNNPKYRLWFHFKVSNCKAGQRALFSIVNFSKSRSLFRDGMSPLVCSSSRPTWERIPAKNCFYYRSPKANNGYVLSFVFIFDKESDKYAFAYSYPFTYTHQQRLLAHVEWRNLPYVQRFLVCRSVQHRRVDALLFAPPRGGEAGAPGPKAKGGGRQRGSGPSTAGAAGLRAAAGAAKQRRRVVVVCARVHPGETPASFCVTGLINYLLSTKPEVVALRHRATLVVIPMLNPDGAFLGNYRTCSLGTDLNRMWGSPTEATEPTLYHTKELIRRLSEDDTVQLDFVIDIHAHSTATTGFFLCNPPDDKTDLAEYERASVFPQMFAARARDFSLSACRFCDEPSKMGSGRRGIAAMTGRETLCYTLELSFFPSPTTAEDGYSEFGAQLGQTFADFYKIHGKQSGGESPWATTFARPSPVLDVATPAQAAAGMAGSAAQLAAPSTGWSDDVVFKLRPNDMHTPLIGGLTLRDL